MEFLPRGLPDHDRRAAGRGVRRPKIRLRPSGHGSEPVGEESEAEAGAAALAGRGRGFEGGHPDSPALDSDGVKISARANPHPRMPKRAQLGQPRG